MKIIDAHVHLFDTPEYLSRLIRVMDDYDIEKCCISGLGKLFKCVDNQGIKKALKKYPNRLIGAVFIRPGIDTSQDIYNAFYEGFKMIKVTIPTKPYDDPTFFPLWEAAQELKMPILFHTGVVTIPTKAHNERISSWYMHPMRLEVISNTFPKLNLIIGHFGVHWNDDAAELLRMKDNIYSDLSGAPKGWRVRVDNIGIKKWLWWPDAFKKIIFGTDVIYSQISQILMEDKTRLDKYNIDPKTQELIFSGNILKLLGER
ncbi:MAG: amidohydrolase family protein [Candidatus Lokiarchaeota archaeon]|nr:amidohydrolase family protein [Candidatus Lokiarchaeota archaeon]